MSVRDELLKIRASKEKYLERMLCEKTDLEQRLESVQEEIDAVRSNIAEVDLFLAPPAKQAEPREPEPPRYMAGGRVDDGVAHAGRDTDFVEFHDAEPTLGKEVTFTVNYHDGRVMTLIGRVGETYCIPDLVILPLKR